jgi:transcriptional regulator with XRE-family HTH domain
MGVSYSQVGHWQNGTRFPRLDDFFKLCEFIRSDPRVILFGEFTVDAAIETIRQPHLTLAHSSETEELPPLPSMMRRRPFKKKPRKT